MTIDSEVNKLYTEYWHSNISGQEFQRKMTNLMAQEAKAFGGCRNCYGKGYATVIESSSWSDTDSDIGSPGGSGKATAHTIKYCSCDRGKQLQQVVAQEANKARLDEAKWWSGKSVWLLKAAMDNDPAFDSHNKEMADRIKGLTADKEQA